MEKSELMPLLFSDADFDLMRRVHDAFNPDASLNPGKIFPLSKGCGEIRVALKPPPSERRMISPSPAFSACLCVALRLRVIFFFSLPKIAT